MSKSEKIDFNEEEKKFIEGGSIGSITIMPGKSVIIKTGTIICGNTVKTEQSLTNNSDSEMKLVHNDKTDNFELQSIDEKIDFNEDEKKVIEGGSVGSITIMPGRSVTIKAGSVIGGNIVNTDQSFTNNNDSTMKLVFNEENDNFELQPIGEVEYLS